MVYWHSIKHLNYRGYIYVWANLLWIALSLPIVTAPAAWAGLVVLSHHAQTQKQVTLDVFWEGFRKHIWRATLNGFISFLVIIINISNIIEYATGGLVNTILTVVWVSVLIVWIGIQLYVWSIMEELETPSLWLAYKNAFFMVIRNPLLTVGIMLVAFVIFIIGVILPPITFLLVGSMVAILSTSATVQNLHNAGYVNPNHDPPDVNIKT